MSYMMEIFLPTKLDKIKCFLFGHKVIAWNGIRSCRRCHAELDLPYLKCPTIPPPEPKNVFIAFRKIIDSQYIYRNFTIKNFKCNKMEAIQHFENLYFLETGQPLGRFYKEMVETIEKEGKFKYRGVTVICN